MLAHKHIIRKVLLPLGFETLYRLKTLQKPVDTLLMMMIMLKLYAKL